MIGTSGSTCSLANTTCDRVFSFDSPPSLEVGDDDDGVVIYTTVNIILIPQHVTVAVLLLVKMYSSTMQPKIAGDGTFSPAITLPRVHVGYEN